MGHAMSKTEMVDVSSFLRHYVLRPDGAVNKRQ
jgi:phospholipase/carboxylesterase